MQPELIDVIPLETLRDRVEAAPATGLTSPAAGSVDPAPAAVPPPGPRIMPVGVEAAPAGPVRPERVPEAAGGPEAAVAAAVAPPPWAGTAVPAGEPQTSQ